MWLLILIFKNERYTHVHVSLKRQKTKRVDTKERRQRRWRTEVALGNHCISDTTI